MDNDPAIEQKRADARQRRLLKAHMLHPRHGRIDILVRDVSAHGIGGKCDRDLMAGEAVTICLPAQAAGLRAEQEDLIWPHPLHGPC